MSCSVPDLYSLKTGTLKCKQYFPLFLRSEYGHSEFYVGLRKPIVELAYLLEKTRLCVISGSEAKTLNLQSFFSRGGWSKYNPR